MILTIWVTWVTFWWVEWVSSANQIFWMWHGYHMFIRKQCWHLVRKWNFGSDECIEIWRETSLLSQTVLKHVVSQDFIFKESVQGTGSESCQEWKNLWHCSILKIFHVMLHYFWKENFNMWVKCWSHPYCSVGQVGQQVWPTFNPDKQNC